MGGKKGGERFKKVGVFVSRFGGGKEGRGEGVTKNYRGNLFLLRSFWMFRGGVKRARLKKNPKLVLFFWYFYLYILSLDFFGKRPGEDRKNFQSFLIMGNISYFGGDKFLQITFQVKNWAIPCWKKL